MKIKAIKRESSLFLKNGGELNLNENK